MQQTVQATGWFLTECTPAELMPRTIAVGAFPFIIGRLPESSLCLAAPSISKLHAEIVAEGDRLAVRDLGSTNGTFVNQRRVMGKEPLRDGDLLQIASEVFRVQRRHPDAHLRTVAHGSFALVESLCQFDRLMSERAVTVHFQPVVRLANRQVVGWEALARGTLRGLESPAAMFQAAERLNQEVALSVMLRREAAAAGRQLPRQPTLFLNTHPKELGTPELLASLEEARGLAPDQIIVVEVHEAAVTDERALLELRARARGLGMQLAYDDFGAGQARLDELARVAPDCVKFDIRLVRDLHIAPVERRLVTARLVELVRELGIVPLAEGIECAEEVAACLEIGFELGQGYFLGRPVPIAETAALAARP